MVTTQSLETPDLTCGLLTVARARKIKCDESKPQCARCQRANVTCEGYPQRAYSDDRNTPYPGQSELELPKPRAEAVRTKETRPAYAMLDGFRTSAVQDRLARIGCSVLRSGLHDQFEANRAVFEYLLPQLSHALPSVNAAAAALGAVYEMQTAPLITSDGKTWNVEAQYGTAIRQVQHELRHRPYGTVPILVACILLACTDVFHRRLRSALMHLQGAIKLLEGRNAASATAKGASPLSPGVVGHGLCPQPGPLLLEEEDDEITALFRMLDVHTSSFADGRPPDMQIALVPTSPNPASSRITVQRTSRELIAIIQACYCFTSQASQCKYLPKVLVPADLLIQQGHHLGALKLWLRRLTHDILPTLEPSARQPSAATVQYTHCLILRNLCISTIIYASTILDPHETDWDIHARNFQNIVTGAEMIHACRRRQRGEAWPSSTLASTFTPSPGIIQPLYLTALKYRHPIWRRRALELLRQSGVEGPWHGRFMAAGAQCAIHAEESEFARDANSSVKVGKVDAGSIHLESLIPERLRISGCGTDVEGVSQWERTQGGKTVSQMRLSRCKDVNGMLAAGLEEQDPAKQPAFKHKRHWDIWTETVEF